MSELDDAVAEYIASRKEAAEVYDRLKDTDPQKAYEEWRRIDSAAWEKFFPIKVKHWNIDHPDDQYTIVEVSG